MTEYKDVAIQMCDRINQALYDFDAPRIPLQGDERENTEAFVEFNEWAKTADKRIIQRLATEFELLPLVLFSTGISHETVQLLQTSSQPDLDGCIRYIDIALSQVPLQKLEHITKVRGDLMSHTETKRVTVVYDVLDFLVSVPKTMQYDEALTRYYNV